MTKLLAVVLVGMTLGCGGDDSGRQGDGIACIAIAIAGLRVDVKDGVTSEPLCDARVTARDGGYTELLIANSCSHVGAFERPGTYSIRAEKPGYSPKEAVGVQVVMDGGVCPHVREEKVSLSLAPVGASSGS